MSRFCGECHNKGYRVALKTVGNKYVCPRCKIEIPILNREQQLEVIRRKQEASKPHCPYCNSTNLERITALGRMVSVGTLGLASNKMGKNFKCKNCKATF